MMKADDLYRIIWMSRPLMQAAEASVEQGLVGTGLTVRMRAVLEILHEHGDATVPEIAQVLEIKRQYVQVMVNDTLAAGLVVQRPNPRHKRSTMLALTDPGRALIERVIAAERRVIGRIGAGIDAADARVALNVVRALTENLKSQGDAVE